MITVLDVGGSSIKAGLVDDALRPVGEVTSTSLDNGAPSDELLDRFVAAARSVDAGAAIALAMPDPFDHEAGTSRMTHKFAALNGVPLVELLAVALGGKRDIRSCNDAAAAVVGEAIAGAGAAYQRVLGLTLGTGLGAAFVVDGRIVSESAGIVIGDLYRRQLDDGRSADDALSARGYQERRNAGEPDLAMAFGCDLGAFIEPIASALDAEVVVIGGGGSGSFDEFAPHARATMSAPLACAELGPWAPIVGAARICFA